MTVSTHAAFPHIFTPYRIKNVELRNRLVISGHHAYWWSDKGVPNPEFAAYIEERAKGGIGLFVIGGSAPVLTPSWIENVDDAVIPGYRRCVEAAHRHGTAIFA